jgi:hypothetical protein
MPNLLPLPIALLLSLCALPAAAEALPDPLQAIAQLAPDLRHLDFVWAEAQGDLNGDGIPDRALLLTGSKGAEAPREERLVVLAGVPGGGYRLLSVSGEFCHPSKFYDLEIRERALFVAAVETADAARDGRSTLHFRYNAKLKDLELIGEELQAIVYEPEEVERTSTNHLTGKVVHTSKSKGKTKTRTERIAHPTHPALTGWVCRG